MTQWIGALHHGFLEGIARRSSEELRPQIAKLVGDLHRAEQRLGGVPLRMHPAFLEVDTGAGTFLSWANRHRRDATYQAVVELLLHRTSGPWVTGLPDGQYTRPVAPSLDGLFPWLAESLRWLMGYRIQASERRAGMVAFHQAREDAPQTYSAEGLVVHYFVTLTALDEVLARDFPAKSTLKVLEEVASQLGDQVVVLESARKSAKHWTLDCPTHELHRAILGLPVYAKALLTKRPDGQRISREEAARVYHHETTIPMSCESGNLSPNGKRERTFRAGAHGPKLFDMHAKPGNMTRVHVWVATESTPEGAGVQRIYIGHCGRHLGK